MKGKGWNTSQKYSRGNIEAKNPQEHLEEEIARLEKEEDIQTAQNAIGNAQTQDPEQAIGSMGNTGPPGTETNPKAQRTLKKGRGKKKTEAPRTSLLSDTELDSDK